MSSLTNAALVWLAAAPEKAAALAPATKLLTALGLAKLGGALVVIVSLSALVWTQLSKRQRQRGSQDGAAGLTANTLRQLWEQFLARLPRGPRALVARYPSVVVFGPTGSGKSQVIRSFVDWQGQSSQFLPSLIDNPLAQIYLGHRLLVEELGAQILHNNAPVVQEALRRLWAPLCKERAPMALVTLKLPTLERSSPEERAELGYQLRGKLALLGKLVGGAVEVRVVLTHMDQVPGFVSFARFCAAHQIPLSLPIAGATQVKDVATAAEALAKYLPLALTKLDAAEYRQVVTFLKEVPRVALALEGLLLPLLEWSVSSAAPSVDRLYLFSTTDGAHGSNPFAGRRVQPISGLAARLKAILPPWLRGAQWHLLAASGILALAAIVIISSAVRHGRAIRRASEAVETFAETVHRAQVTLGDVRESPAVRTASHEAREALDVLNVTEGTWAIHNVLYRGSRMLVKDKFLETTRNAYFLPLLGRFGAQRDTERTLHTLAVIYAARDNALGSLVNSELRDIANSLEISDAVITDYINMSEQGWQSAAAVPWQRLLSGAPPAAAQPQTWLRFFREVQQAYRLQGVTPEQLRQLQQSSAPLLRVADAVRGKRKLAQMLNAIAEESPLVEIEQRVGAHHPELAPKEWLRDQQAAISGILRLIHDTDQATVRAGQMSLVQVLRLLTDLDTRKQSEDHVFQFEIEEQSFSFSQRAWQDILLRGRNQLVLGALYKGSDVSGIAPTHGVAEEGPAARSPDDGARSAKKRLGASRKERGSRRHRGAKRSKHHRGKAAAHEPSAAADTPRVGPGLRPPERGGAEITASEAAQYSRASFEQNMKALLQKLDKALSSDSGLPAPQRQFLTRYVQDEARRYAEKYCAALLVQHRGYVFPGGDLVSTRSALLDLATANGSLVSHLKRVADNVSLPNLEGRFTQNLASCLGLLAPVVAVVASGKDGGYPALKPYTEIIAGMLKELDAGKPAEVREDGKQPSLQDLLTPLGRIGFSVLAEQEGSPQRKVMQYLESAGLAGPLAPPFLAPVQHVAKLGLADVEQVLATQWNTALLPIVRPLLGRYPLDRRAERELQPAELDLLKPGDGPFWSAFRQTFGPVLLEQRGQWQARKWEHGSLALPKDMLPMVNQLATLSAALFGKDGARRALLVEIKPLPTQACDPKNPVAGSFLAVGKGQVFGSNTKPAVSTLPVPWWQQDIASVGLESGKRPGERATQSIEVADSQWSFFRLLERAEQEHGIYSWKLPSDDSLINCEVRFEIANDPTPLFRLGKK